MKSRLHLSLLFLTTFVCISYAQGSKTIELPLTTVKGLGPFPLSYSGLAVYRENASDNPWEGTYTYAKNIPYDWTEVKQGAIETNIYQSVYQNYHAGKITEKWYNDLQRSWNWTPDNTLLTDKPVKTQVLFATGKDATGAEKIIIDRNNNRDFGDDTPFAIPDVNWADPGDNLSNTIDITIETFTGGEIVSRTIPFLVVKEPTRNMLMINFPEYAVVELEGEKIAVVSGANGELSYRNTHIAILHDELNEGNRISEDKLIKNDNYLTINGKIYQNKGVDTSKGALLLKETTSPKEELYSTQVGYKAMPFEGENHVTKEKISLDRCKGKYVLIDFWAVWCGPCLQEMPNLKALYEKTDRSRFEIIGIIGDSPIDGVNKVMEKFEITWPQVVSDQNNNITKAYNVNSYPTVLLLDPEGFVIAKDLRGGKLEEKIAELLK